MAAEVLQVVAMEVEIKEDLKVTTWTSLLLEKIWEEVQQEYLQDSLVKDHLVLDKVHHQDMEAQWEEVLDQDHIEDHLQEECHQECLDQEEFIEKDDKYKEFA